MSFLNGCGLTRLLDRQALRTVLDWWRHNSLAGNRTNFLPGVRSTNGAGFGTAFWGG